jgi:hypothetical protein
MVNIFRRKVVKGTVFSILVDLSLIIIFLSTFLSDQRLKKNETSIP